MGYKVLFITFWYPNPKDTFSGIFIKEHAKSIIDEGHELVILHFDITNSRSLFRLKRHCNKDYGSSIIYRIEIRSRLWKWFHHFYPLLNLLAWSEYKKMVNNKFQPQIIHANVTFPSGLIGYYLGKKMKIPVVLTEHWSGLENFYRHPIFGKITRKAISSYKCIMPVSNYLGDIIRKYTNELQLINVIPNVADSNIFQVKSPTDDPDLIRFLIVANWQSRKNIAKRPDLIIDALKIFANSTNKKVLLRIAGDGDLLDTIKNDSPSYNFKCEFFGYQEKSVINQLLKVTDFFLHASNFETFSIVTVEALLTGTPVIVSDLPALRELVNPDNGLLVKNDAREWAEAIRSAVNKEWDHEKIASSVLNIYSYLAVGRKFTAVYSKVLMNY